MARLRYNALRATLGASLTNSATSVTFGAALTHSNGTAVPTITGSDYIPLAILDSSGHLSEVVYLTAYTSGSTTGTIVRGKEGTSGLAHSSGDPVICSGLVSDLPSGLTQLRKSVTQSVSPATWTALTWDVEDYDALGLHDNATNNTRITAVSAGTLRVSAHVGFTGGGGQQYLSYYVNGVQQMGWAVGNGVQPFALSLIREFVVSPGDYVEVYIYTGTGTMTIYKDISGVIAGTILTAQMVGV